MEKKKYHVEVRALVQGTLEIEATSKRKARELALTQLSIGLPVLDAMHNKRMVAHDAQGRSKITECDTAEQIGKIRD